MTPLQLRRTITKAFSLSGLGLEYNAQEVLAKELAEVRGDQLQQTLKDLLGRIHEAGTLTSPVVDMRILEPILSGLGNNNVKPRLAILHADRTPAPIYNQTKKVFQTVKSFSTVDDALAKANVFALRYDLLLQQAERVGQISLPSFDSDIPGGDEKRNYGPMRSTIESLSGNPGTKTIFGLLSEIEEGKCYLEDKTAHVQLDLSHEPSVGPGFIAWNCFAFVRGKYDEDEAVFKVKNLEMPRPEVRSRVVESFPNLPEDIENAAEDAKLSEKCSESIFVFSEVHLDNPDVLNGLKTIFHRFNQDQSASVFVLCGNFTSSSESSNVAGRGFLNHFRQLALIIQDCKFLAAHAHFIIIPGPQDPGCSAALPRPPLVPSLVKLLRQVASHVTIGSNPMRIYCGGKEIVFFRDDLMFKIRRNCCIPPNDRSEPTKQLLDTICAQNHLCSLPLMIQPQHWKFWHALQLYPLPDYLVLADQGKQSDFSDMIRHDVRCVGVSSFATVQKFLMMHAESDTVTLCDLNAAQ